MKIGPKKKKNTLTNINNKNSEYTTQYVIRKYTDKNKFSPFFSAIKFSLKTCNNFVNYFLAVPFYFAPCELRDLNSGSWVEPIFSSEPNQTLPEREKVG